MRGRLYRAAARSRPPNARRPMAYRRHRVWYSILCDRTSHLVWLLRYHLRRCFALHRWFVLEYFVHAVRSDDGVQVLGRTDSGRSGVLGRKQRSSMGVEGGHRDVRFVDTRLLHATDTFFEAKQDTLRVERWPASSPDCQRVCWRSAALQPCTSQIALSLGAR